MMTPADFEDVATQLEISRAELVRRLGIAPNTGTAYALGRQPIPRPIALACAALLYKLPAVGDPEPTPDPE